MYRFSFPGRFLVLLLCLAAVGRAQYSIERLTRLDRPFQGDQIALSPDGTRIAYTRHDGRRLYLEIAEWDKRPGADRKVLLSTLLKEDTDDRKPRTTLLTLRWSSPDRMYFVTSEAELYAVDGNGQNARRLWDATDDGLIGAAANMKGNAVVRTMTPGIFSEEYIPGEQPGEGGMNIIPHPPRVIGPVPGEPDMLFVESVARVGAESFSNLFRLNVRTGETTLANGNQYLNHQVALYGGGDLLIWGPLAIYPPLMEIPPQQLVEDIAPSTEHGMPPGKIIADSSHTGRMLYDRQGRPRILYSFGQRPYSDVRPFYYFPIGGRFFEPNLGMKTLDAFLGQPKAQEFAITADNYFGERSYPLAFDIDPNLLYIASNVGRDTFGIYLLNLATKERKEVIGGAAKVDFAGLEPDFDSNRLVFDEHTGRLVGVRFHTTRPFTTWLDGEMAQVQATAERNYPEHAVEIVGWDAARARMILRVTAEDDPGMYFVLDRKEAAIDPFLSRAPWLDPSDISISRNFAFDSPDGGRIYGTITLPAKPKVTPVPLIVYCQGGLWDRTSTDFHREAQVLASAGMVVMRVNYRGTAGFGRSHLTAIQEGLDSVPLADIRASLEWLAGRYKYDATRVVIMGEGFGGYLALRGIQIHPDLFRAGISLNAPTSLRAWARPRSMNGLKDMKVGHATYVNTALPPPEFRSYVRAAFVEGSKRTVDEAGSGDFRKPVLVIENPVSPDVTGGTTLLSRIGLGPSGARLERLVINGDFENGTLETRDKVFKRIELFLNESLFEFGSRVGNLREAKSPPQPPAKK